MGLKQKCIYPTIPPVTTLYIVKDKNALIQALALIIDLYQSNPLVVNKLIVAEEEVLIKLLLLLTEADEVELVKKDFDVGCLCKVVNIRPCPTFRVPSGPSSVPGLMH